MFSITDAMTPNQLDLYNKFKTGNITCMFEENSQTYLACFFMDKPYIINNFKKISTDRNLDAIFLMVLANGIKETKKYKFIEVNLKFHYDNILNECIKNKLFVQLISNKFFVKKNNFYKIISTEDSVLAKKINQEIFISHIISHMVLNGYRYKEINFYHQVRSETGVINVENIRIIRE